MAGGQKVAFMGRQVGGSRRKAARGKRQSAQKVQPEAERQQHPVEESEECQCPECQEARLCQCPECQQARLCQCAECQAARCLGCQVHYIDDEDDYEENGQPYGDDASDFDNIDWTFSCPPVGSESKDFALLLTSPTSSTTQSKTEDFELDDCSACEDGTASTQSTTDDVYELDWTESPKFGSVLPCSEVDADGHQDEDTEDETR